ncbi:MAG: alpha/beta hydrolase [Balneolaceae bacterium]|nr:MAG: alpha/beta hydrolase [Balneolaceae bacterium]
MSETSLLTDFEGKSLYLHTWQPEQVPVGVIQILHGMAEHAGRYNMFANRLTGNGYAVYAHDHRGHGKTDPDQLGFISEQGGFDLLVQNVEDVNNHIKRVHPDIPIAMFGHSMGSFLVQRFLQKSSFTPDAVIYSGSNGKPPVILNAGILIASLLIKLFGPEAKSPLLEKMSFGAYNKTFKPNRTEFDWLSRDNKMVDLYIDDPLCGFTCTTSFYHQLFTGIKAIHSHKPFSDHSKEIPILILSGDHDPVSNMGKGIKSLEKSIRSSGVNNLDVQIYPGGRHELLNETNREVVMDFMINWIRKKLHG